MSEICHAVGTTSAECGRGAAGSRDSQCRGLEVLVRHPGSKFMIGIDRDWQGAFFDMYKPIRTPIYPRATHGMNRRKGEHTMNMSERFD